MSEIQWRDGASWKLVFELREQVAEQRAEIEYLRQSILRHADEIKALDETVANYRQRERAAADMVAYAGHLRSCAIYAPYAEGDPPHGCNCEFESVRAAWLAAKGESDES